MHPLYYTVLLIVLLTIDRRRFLYFLNLLYLPNCLRADLQSILFQTQEVHLVWMTPKRRSVEYLFVSVKKKNNVVTTYVLQQASLDSINSLSNKLLNENFVPFITPTMATHRGVKNFPSLFII